jgi:hypothetical protein
VYLSLPRGTICVYVGKYYEVLKDKKVEVLSNADNGRSWVRVVEGTREGFKFRTRTTSLKLK